MKSCPTFSFEEKFWHQGLQYVAGLDEVGKGAFAGPVVAAAVILPNKQFAHSDEINDSKLLPAKKREFLTEIIKDNAISYAIAEISVEIINRIGIGKATSIALSDAVGHLHIKAQHYLIDGFAIPTLQKDKQTAIVKGDQKSFSIAAASIIAKVYRDELMKKFDPQYLHYQFAKHKGYGTKMHRDAIKQYGLCPLHRTSFDLQKFL